MRRIVPVVLFCLGIVWLVLALLKVVPGGFNGAVGLAFFGVLLFGLSFIPKPAVTESSPAPMSHVERLVGVFFEPSKVFQNLRVHPGWVAPLIVIALANAAYFNLFVARVGPERIANHVADKVAEISFIPQEQAEQIRQQTKQDQLNSLKPIPARIAAGSNAFLSSFFFASVISAISLVLLLIMGGKLNFWQGVAIYLHAAVPVVLLHRIVSSILLFVKDPADIPPLLGQETLLQDNLGILFSPAEHPVLFVLGSAIGVMSFYGLWLKATGFQHGAERCTSGAAWTVSCVFWVVGLLIGLIVAVLFPQFIA